MTFFNLFLNVSYCDAAYPWQTGIQDPATPVMEGMIFFHNYIMIFLIFVGVTVLWLLMKIVMDFNSDKNKIVGVFTHSSLLEIIWTIIPAIVLILIAVPSFTLLYSLDELIDPVLTLKVVGHQWYWSYEYSDCVTFNEAANVNFDSYMVPTSDLADTIGAGSFRLLEVDNHIELPVNTHIRVLVTSADVLHSWAVPSFGIKIDACPGRLSQGSLFLKREGVYYGQCSEICGVNHGFMPIVVNAVSRDSFADWINIKLEDLE